MRQLLKQLNQKPPLTADAKALGKVALQTAFTGTKTGIDLKKLALVLDDTQLQGDLSVLDFANPDIRFGIGIDKLNADRYLPESFMRNSGQWNFNDEEDQDEGRRGDDGYERAERDV